MGGHTIGKKTLDYLQSCAPYPDPGNAGVIGPVENGKTVIITSAANTETRTLEAASLYPIGLTLTLISNSAYDCTISTIESAAGSSSVVLQGIGDWVEVMVGYSGTADTKAWRVKTWNGSAVLPT